MQILTHTVHGQRIAEIRGESILIHGPQDSLDLLGDVYYQGFDKIILHEKNITPEFFRLKSGLAGEMLQKYSNYRVRLAIVGDFSDHTGQSILDFMRESNRQGHINFTASLAEALEKLAK